MLAGWEVAGAQATIPRVWRRIAYLTAHLIGHTKPSRVTAGNPRGNHNNYTTRGGQGASWTGREAGSRRASLPPPLHDPKNPHPHATDRWDSRPQAAPHSVTDRTPLDPPHLRAGSADAARNVLRCRRRSTTPVSQSQHVQSLSPNRSPRSDPALSPNCPLTARCLHPSDWVQSLPVESHGERFPSDQRRPTEERLRRKWKTISLVRHGVRMGHLVCNPRPAMRPPERRR